MAAGYLYDIWVANYGSGTVQQIVDGVAQPAITVGTNPYGICVDKDNAAWAASYTSGKAHKIVGGAAQPAITLAAKPHGICVDKDNNSWSVAYTSHKAIKIVAGVAQAGILLGSGSWAICVDKNNHVWTANYTAGTVQQIIDGVAQPAIAVGYHPIAICADRSNDIWVANYGSGTVQRIVGDAAQPAISVGAGPTALCIDRDNRLWVACYAAGTVQQIVDGDPQTAIPVGTNPSGVCIDKDNNIWVSNYGSGTVQKIVGGVAQAPITVGTGPYIFGDGSGMQAALLFGWGGEDPGPAILRMDTKRALRGEVTISVDTKRLAVDAMAGYLSDYWSVNGDGTIQRVRDGAAEAALTGGSGSFGVCVDRHNVVWVTNANSSTLTRIACGVAENYIACGTAGPMGICVDKDGNIWTCGTWENTIARVVNGVAEAPISLGEWGVSSFYGICCDKNNHIWVTDTALSQVYELVNGALAATIAVGSTPRGICCDKNNTIWLANSGAGTVEAIIGGVKQPAIPVGTCPIGVCCDLSGDIWITNNEDGTVQKIAAGVAGPAIAVGNWPSGISCDAAGAIWVANNGDATVQQIVGGVAQAAISVQSGPLSFGDATGQQLALICAGDQPEPEPQTVVAGFDSQRQLAAVISRGVDALRLLVTSESAAADTRRSLIAGSTLAVDTARALTGGVVQAVDTWRYDLAGRITTVRIDTARTTVSTKTLLADTWRSTTAVLSLNVDTLRKVTVLIHAAVAVDTARQKCKPESKTCRFDTLRAKAGSFLAAFDTNRRRKAAMADFRSFSISLRARVLADSYNLVTLKPVALGTEYEGTLYGWYWSCTIRQHSQTGAEFSLTGGYGVSEMLKQYISFPSAQGATSLRRASEIMNSAAAQLGKSLHIAIDDLSVNPLGETTVLMDCISSLFSWTSSIPQQSVNVFLRGATLHVIQRGKETSVYRLEKYGMPTIGSEKVTTLMAKEPEKRDPETGGLIESPSVVRATQEEVDSWEETVAGTWSFSGSSVTYVNGLCVRAVVEDGESETITSYGYSPDNYVLSKTVSVYGKTANAAVRETRHTFSYGYWDNAPYLGQEVVLSFRGGDLESRTVTDHYPLGLNFYGTQEKVYAVTRDENGAASEKLTSTQSSITEGRPGGKSSPYTLSQSRKRRIETVTVTMPSTPTTPSTIPATDAATLKRYADGLVWLNGKTQISCLVECYDAHIVDFLERIDFLGKEWYLESSTISLSGDSPAPRQKLEMVRWE